MRRRFPGGESGVVSGKFIYKIDLRSESDFFSPEGWTEISRGWSEAEPPESPGKASTLEGWRKLCVLAHG